MQIANYDLIFLYFSPHIHLCKRLPKVLFYGLFIFLFVLLCSLPSPAREKKTPRKGKGRIEVKDSVPVLSDSARAVLDSIHRSDSIRRADSLEILNKSSLEMPAFTDAKDSIIENFVEGHRVIYYYGDVKVTYGDMTLTADYMEYDLQTGNLYARGTTDSTGVTKGAPVMTSGGKTYSMEEMRYNFKSKKARVTNMITNEQDGILHGKNIKMMPDQSINLTKGKYTVCDLEHPHYYLSLSAAKVITKPSQKTVFGPAWPVIEDVPIPIGLPFGFIPKRPDRATGLLMPTFGEETSRGFFLKDAGMYFVIGDYFDISITGDVFTLGSWALNVNSRYKVNYKCNGTFSIAYSYDQTGEKGSADFFTTTNFSLRWSHSQDSKAHPGANFSASVNFSSPSNSRYNSRSVQEALQNQISSSISYSRNWDGKFNLSVNALHSQNSRDSSYAITLPNLTFSVSKFYPFKQKNRVGKEKFYEKFSLAYSTSFSNKVNFKVRDFMGVVMDPNTGLPAIDPVTGYTQREFSRDSLKTKLPKMLNNGMTHSFSIGLPNFTLFKYINVTPSISYGMNWAFSKSTKELVDALDKDGNPIDVLDKEGNPVRAKEVKQVDGGAFSTFGATHNYSGSISMNTRIYGLFNFGKYSTLQAIRHVISPSLSLSYSPDKGKAFNGWRTLDGYYDKNGYYHEPSDYNIYNISPNNSVSAPGKGKTGSLGFSIGNNFEAKVKDYRDTTGTGSKKIKLIDQLNISGSYNFLADSLRLSNIGITMSTSVFEKIGISANLNFDPYAMVPVKSGSTWTAKKINQWHVKYGKGLMRLVNANASLSYAISGEGKSSGDDGKKSVQGAADAYTRIYYHPVTGEYIPGGWLYYVNTSAPWSVNFNYSFSMSRSYQCDASGNLVTKNNFTQTLGVSGNVKLTDRLSINASTGFDLMALKLTTSQVSATYDLHCFNISFSWVPFGTWQSWSFLIRANAAALADLLRYKKSSSYWDN